MRSITAALIFASTVASTAYAKDLPDKELSTGESYNGAVVERVRSTFAKTGSPISVSVDLLQRSLERLGHAQQQLDGKVKARWKVEQDSLAGKVRLVRERRRGDGTFAQFGERGDYVGRTPALGEAALVAKGSAIVRELVSKVGLARGADEFRPDSTRVLKHFEADATGNEVATVVAAEVLLRRYVDGVPVVGARGQASATFDADGSLVELTLPSRAVASIRPWNPARPRGSLLSEALARRGFRHLGSRHSFFSRKGNVKVREYRCGYVDEASTDVLKVGCDLVYTEPDGEPQAALIIVDGSEAAPPASGPARTPVRRP